MNRNSRNLLRPAFLATALALSLVAVVVWLAAVAQPIRADGTLSGDYKTVTPAFAQPGDIVTYTIVVNNSGVVSDMTTLVTDPLHSLLTYVPGSAHPTPDNTGTLIIGTGGISWTLTISPATAVTLTFQAQVSPGATDGTIITNTATISKRDEVIERSAAVTVNLLPTAQIHTPNKNAIITQKDSLTISGYAWDYGVTPPFIVGTPALSVQKAGERSYFLNWTAVISAEFYLIQESDDLSFADSTETFVSAPSTSHAVTKDVGEDGTYYYRVRATHPDLQASRWSNVKSVVVPWTLTTRDLAVLNPSAANNTLTVQVRIDDGPWQPASVMTTAWGGWAWSYDWSPLPQELDTPHLLQARATDVSGVYGPIDAITITLNNKTYPVYFPLIIQRYPPIPYAPSLEGIENADTDGDYRVSWSYNPPDSAVTADTFTLQEATDSDFTSDVYNYPSSTGTYRDISDQTPDIYYYRVRGNNSYGPGEWSNFRAVSVLPGTPVLDDIDNPDKSASYIISWSEGRDAESYVLQEATSNTFDDAVIKYSGSERSYEVTGSSSGTYYYRVRSVYQDVSSPWSNVVSTEVKAGFYDNFGNSGTGWPQTTYWRGTDPDGEVMTVEYKSGTYRMKILLDTLGLNNKRMGIVKSPYVNSFVNYDVEVEHYFDQASDQTVDPTWGKGGLVFGASEDYKTVFIVEWHFPSGSDAPQCAVYKYTDVTLPTSIVWTAGGTPLRGWAPCAGLKGGYDQENHILVEVRGNRATVYINSYELGSFSDSGLGSNHLVGLMTGSWERTPVESRFDDFRVTPK